MEPKSQADAPQKRVKRRDVLFFSSGDAFQPFNYGVGEYGARFFKALRDDEKFLAVRCPGCKRVYVPPRRVCGPCYKTMDEWLEVGPQGTVVAFTVLRFQFIDPETGQKKPVPYGYGFIRLDGATSCFQHFLAIQEGKALEIGMRVRPVFEERRVGNLRDVKHFESL